MDLKGSLVDANLKIYPSEKLIRFFETLPISNDIPINIAKFLKNYDVKCNNESKKEIKPVVLCKEDIQNLNTIKKIINTVKNNVDENAKRSTKNKGNISDENLNNKSLNNNRSKLGKDDDGKFTHSTSQKKIVENKKSVFFLTTSDIDWLYAHLQERRSKNEKEIPYLHVILEGSHIEMPENVTIKRNPVLEERCKKLRAQQEAREYRKMTKSVDNVRMRFPEDSIAYQLKSLNRQLIAIGQFIISIFAGFLFGFKGIEWMVGNLDFGFRLLLGVMCALVIALAEIYFLAKQLNEELNIQETVQLGGPPKFVNEPTCHGHKIPRNENKEHWE